MKTIQHCSLPIAPTDKTPAPDMTHPAFIDLPVAVQSTIQVEGDPQNIRDIKTTTRKGQVVYTVKTQHDGKNVTLHIAEDGALKKGFLSWFGW